MKILTTILAIGLLHAAFAKDITVSARRLAGEGARRRQSR